MQHNLSSTSQTHKSLYEILPTIEDLELDLKKAEKEYAENFDLYFKLSLNYISLSLKAHDLLKNKADIPKQLAPAYNGENDSETTEFKHDPKLLRKKIQRVTLQSGKLSYINVILLHDCTRLVKLLAENVSEFNTPLARKVLEGNVMFVSQKLLEKLDGESQLKCKL